MIAIRKALKKRLRFGNKTNADIWQPKVTICVGLTKEKTLLFVFVNIPVGQLKWASDPIFLFWSRLSSSMSDMLKSGHSISAEKNQPYK